MKILVVMNQLSALVGGSLVPLEVLEYFAERSHECYLAAHFVDEPMKSIAEKSGIRIIDDMLSINAFDFDIVWIQNHTAPLLKYEIGPNSVERTLFVFAHLSSQTPLECPGLIYEPLLADLVFANSPETKAHLISLGVSQDSLSVYPNPAPKRFWDSSHKSPIGALKTVLLISNHPPKEALDTLDILAQRGIRVRAVGRNGHYRRVDPYLLERTSAVISIGKTVQYAIAMGVPAFVYDRFGGPGWLNGVNFESAAASNFSGRCCGRMLGAEQLAEELVQGFQHAAGYTHAVRDVVENRFCLDTYMQNLESACKTAKPNEEKLRDLEAHPLARRERLLGMAIRENFIGHMAANAKSRNLRALLNRRAEIKSQ